MTISEPLSMPANSIRAIKWIPEAVVARAESEFSFVEQVQAHSGQRFMFEVQLKLLNGDLAEEWRGFFLSTNGMQRVFTFGDPFRTIARGAATGTPLVNGGGQSGNTLNTKGWSTGVTGILKAGDYIQLGSGITSRLHQIVQDADSDGSGLSTLDIWPSLRSSPGNNDAVTVSSPVGIFRMAENMSPVDINEAYHYSVSFKIREVV